MKLLWLAVILVCEWVLWRFLTRKWNRQALLFLKHVTDQNTVQGFTAWAVAEAAAIGVGLYFAFRVSGWFLQIAVFLVFFWMTSRPLVFVSLLYDITLVRGYRPGRILQLSKEIENDLKPRPGETEQERVRRLLQI